MDYLKYLKSFALFKEGIDVTDTDKDGKNDHVEVNLQHEKGVSTSLKMNPNKELIKFPNDNDLNIKVFSIFTRKRPTGQYDDTDKGNPLIYALKGLQGWSISQEDKTKLFDQMTLIVKKLKDDIGEFDTILNVPSKNQLNNTFLTELNKTFKIKPQNILSNIVYKLSTRDILGTDKKLNPNEKVTIKSPFVDFETIEKNIQKAIDGGSSYEISKAKKERYDLVKAFNSMGKDFSFKEINPALRHYIKSIYTNTKPSGGGAATAADFRKSIAKEINYADFINGKRVLIIDDTISSGSTLNMFVKTICEMYEPAEIVIITLFSKI